MFHLIFKTARIKQKLILINLLTIGIALLLTGSALLLNVFVSFRNSLVHSLTTQATILSNDCAAPLTFNDQKTAGEDLRALKASPNITYAIIYGKDGKVFAEYRRTGSKRETPPIPPRKDGYLFYNNQLHIFQTIELDREMIGKIYLRSDLVQLHSLMIHYGVIAAITMAFVFGISFLLLSRLQRLITEPIFDLANSMQIVSRSSDYTHKANVDNEDEIGFLANGFNEMLEQIRQRDTKLLTEIAERKEAEVRLRQAKEEWERTFDAIVDPVMIADVHHRIIKANKSMADKLGISPADAEGLACYNAVHRATEPPLFCPHSELLADGLPHSMEIYEERLGGHFIVSVSPLFTPQGEVYGSVHYARDITERKKAEEYLKESEKRFKTIFDNNTDGLAVADIGSKKFVLANPMICRMLGYEEEELKRMNVMDIHPYEDVPYVSEQFEKQARGEITIAEKLPVKRKDGTVFYADINTSPLTLEGKEYLLGAFRDVTDREQAKDALLDSEQKLKTIVYGSPIPQFVIDHDHRVIYWNNALVELTGIKAEEMIGTKDQWRALYAAERPCLADLLLDGTIEKVTEMYREKYKQSRLVANAYEALDFFPTLGKDGKWLHFTAAEIKDAKGKVIGVVETLEDVTERKLAEEAVRRLNEELERKVEERTRQLLDAQEELVRKEKLSILGQLSGSVGHELRNPLGVMSNAVYFLKTIMKDTDETVKEYLDIIKHEIDNSQRIITDLLDFSRTRSPQTKAVPASELVNESLGRCTVPENVELQTELPDMLPALNVDPLQMVQVFQNLITNAVQAMPDGGTLRVAAQLVSSSGFRVSGSNSKPKTQNSKLDGDFIEISVNDTGEGISPEGMKRLFQPLFTTKAKGIGLGLTVCKNLVEANGGHIEVESRLGEGTTFTVSMPVFEG